MRLVVFLLSVLYTAYGVHSHSKNTLIQYSYSQEETTRSLQTLQTHLVIINEYYRSSTLALDLFLSERIRYIRLKYFWLMNLDRAQRFLMQTQDPSRPRDRLHCTSTSRFQKKNWLSLSRKFSPPRWYSVLITPIKLSKRLNGVNSSYKWLLGVSSPSFVRSLQSTPLNAIFHRNNSTSYSRDWHRTRIR